MIRAIAALTLLLGSARADVVELPRTEATLTLPEGWHPVTSEGVVAAYKNDRGGLLAITRADVPNIDAWLTDKKQAYFDRVEKGIKAKLPGYRRLAKKLVDANGIPALDLEARRQGGATVVIRVLLFRSYALSLAIEIAKGGDLTQARTIAHGFAPPKQRERRED